MKLVFSCEHGGNNIPEKYLELFKNAGAALNSHRGIDYGALDLFEFCKNLSDYSKKNTVSRLLIELNRSKHHPSLFSEYSKKLNEKDRVELLCEIYDPYRNDIEKEISNLIKSGEEVLHLSFHSFTPILDRVERNAGLGLLYDPARASEKTIAKKIKSLLTLSLPQLKIRFNYPYLGKADGFTSYLRRKFPENYSGIEIEINQKFSKANILEPHLKVGFYGAIESLRNEI